MILMIYCDVLCKVFDDVMVEDSFIVVIGEEVGCYGGVYGVIKDLIVMYGLDCLIDMLIFELVIVGMVVGVVMIGLCLVVELMYIDFFGMIMDQFVNQVVKICYMFGGQIGVLMVLCM